ncbi:Tryptophan--tRNA ligase, mitochondrial, partial [Nowakowskiella sp. JEL0078]
ATDVPVGEDQLQHINLTCDVATSFNTQYGKAVFPIPKVSLTENSRIMSLRVPTSKMSKSDASIQSRIDLTDTADSIHKKIKKSTTDNIFGITYEPKLRPGISNLLRILDGCLLVLEEKAKGLNMGNSSVNSDIRLQTLAQSYSEHSTAEFKTVVADAVEATFGPIREEYSRIVADRLFLEAVLKDGADKASEVAESTMRDVRN